MKRSDVDNRMQIDSLKKSKEKASTQTRKVLAQATHVLTLEKNCGRTGHWGGRTDDNSNDNTNRCKNKKKGKGKGKQVNVVQTSQSSETASTLSYRRILHRHEALLKLLGAMQTEKKDGGWIITLGGVTISSLSSTRRQAGAEYLFLDGGAQLHACSIDYPGQRMPWSDPGIHTANGGLQHDEGRVVRFKLSEGGTIRVLLPCA